MARATLAATPPISGVAAEEFDENFSESETHRHIKAAEPPDQPRFYGH